MFWGRFSALFYSVLLTCFIILVAALVAPNLMYVAIPFVFLSCLGLYDYLQKSRPVLANFPLIGRFRFMLEAIRPELRQYFWETDKEELPYSRNQRSMVYQRSKELLAARPFGSD